MRRAFGVFFVAVVIVLGIGLLAKSAGMLGLLGGMLAILALYAAVMVKGFSSRNGDEKSTGSGSFSGKHAYLAGTAALLASHSQQTHGSHVGSIAAYQEDESAQSFLTEDLSSPLMESSAFQADENDMDALDLINDPAYSSLSCNIFHSDDSVSSTDLIGTNNPFNSFAYPLDDCTDSSIDCTDPFFDCTDPFNDCNDSFNDCNDTFSSFDDSFNSGFDDSSSSFDD